MSQSDREEPTSPQASPGPIPSSIPPPDRDTPVSAPTEFPPAADALRQKPPVPPWAEYLDWAINEMSQGRTTILNAAERIEGYQRDLFDPGGMLAQFRTEFGNAFRAIDDRLNYGASVMMSLMLHVESQQNRKEMAGPLRGKRILVVDDEVSLLKVMTQLLISRGTNVIAAASADEALRIIGSVRVDAALIDLRVPRPEDGRNLVLWAAERQPDAALVITSGAPLIGERELEGLIYRFIQKPVPLDEVERVLGEAIEEAATRKASREAAEGTE